MIEGPALFPDWLANSARVKADHVVLAASGKQWTFRELDAEATRTAKKLATLGVRPGDHVALLLHNSFEMAVLPHAALRLGASIVPLNVRLNEEEIAWQLADSKPRILIVDSRTRDIARRVLADRLSIRVASTDVAAVNSISRAAESAVELRRDHPADAVLAIIYTSGTTGRPKGAMLTVSNFWWSAIGSALNLGTQSNDRWVACMPLFHVGGLSILIRSAIYGITAIVHEGFDETAVNTAIDDGATIVSVVATMLERMIDQRKGRAYPQTLRCVLVGGGPVPVSLLERCAPMNAPVVQTYGLTETCSQAATLSPTEAAGRHGSSGKPLYPNEIRVQRSADQSANEAGEILVRGPIVMAGYLGQPEATGHATRDGWLHTGDVGMVDEEGFLYVLDRRDDLILTGGENVYPAEVEAVLFSHPAIAEAGVIGIADDKWGQRVVAIARLSRLTGGTPPDAASLDAYCRARIAGYKIPKEFRFVSEPLPRTASGKLRRSALREIVSRG